MASSSSPINQVVHFGEFTADLQEGALFRNGAKLKLQGQPFEILAVLLEHPGRLVTREDLRRRLWPSDTFVDFEHGLNAAVNRLREVLGDSADQPRFIETIPRRGYKFIPAVDGPNSLPVKSRLRKSVSIGSLAVLALAASLIALNLSRLREHFFGSGRKPLQSIAVLPLGNLSNDPQQEYFADGMTEALITELGKISALRVISRQSMMQYKGTKKSAPQIAKELSVEAVVEGSVLRVGNRVRISAQLIQAAPERHLWANSYDRDLRDILALHREMAQAVAREIRASLTSGEHPLPTKTRQIIPAAYENYLHGIHVLWDEATSDSARRAIVYFRSALALDPSLAEAHCGLAYSYIGLGHLAALAPSEAFPAAKSAALTSQQLGHDDSCEHVALGDVYFLYEWNWPVAETEYRRAIELNSSDAHAHNAYATFLAATGRPDQAISQAEKTLQLAPVSSMEQTEVSGLYYIVRQYDLAARQALHVLETAPDFSLAHLYLGLVYEQRGDLDRAIPELNRAFHLAGPRQVFVARASALSGHSSDARSLLAELQRPAKGKYVDPWAVALVYASLDEKDLALKWLEKAYTGRDHDMVFLRIWPQFDSLRSDSRFQQILNRMKFPLSQPVTH